MADSPTLTANGVTFRIVSLRMLVPWLGVWNADVELDPDDVSQVPLSGPASLSLFGVSYSCILDSRYGGTWVAKAAVKVQGGAGGWDNTVPAAHFHSDGAILSTQIYQQTAALVTETINDPSPVSFGSDFVRSLGPASRVFLDRQWYLDPASAVTTVAAWPSSSPDPSLTLIDFDPIQQRATLQGEALVLPGTVLTDPRFNGASYVVREVELSITRNGAHTTVWLAATPTARLSAALQQLVREMGRTAFLASYRYRFVVPVASDYSTLALQAITPGAPDLNPIRQWAGLSGIQAKIPPGLEIVVGFTVDSPPVPFIISYSNLGKPLEVDIAGGVSFVGLAPLIDELFQAIVAAFNAHTHSVSGGSTGTPTPVAIPPVVIPIPTPVASTAATLTKAT